jgi:cation-transporting ATPase 13A1
MELQHPASLKRVRAYEASSSRRTLLLAIAFAVYSYVLPQCYMTAGDPRRTAIAQLEAIDAAKPPEAKIEGVWVGGKLVDQDANNENDEDGFNDGEENKNENLKVDKLVEKLELKEDWRKAFDNNILDSEIKGEDGRSLPSEYLPSAFSCAALFLSLTLTFLFFFLCRWIVSFKAWALYSPITNIDHIKPNKTTLLIEPVKHRGKAAMVKVNADSNGKYVILFQRQKYDVILAQNRAFREVKNKVVGEGNNNGAIVLISCPVDRPVGAYVNSTGLSPAQVTAKLEQYGRNEIRIPTPKILDLLKQQLLSPLAIFQVFCAILWMLDEYWQYTLFTLFSIVALEATTCFQRLRTFSTLGGMASKATPLMVYRDKEWKKMTTGDLLPGDLVSLSRRANSEADKPSDKADGTTTDSSSSSSSEGQGSRDKRSKNETAITTAAKDSKDPKKSPPRVNDVVPCDMLILSGSAVVNEASLTGESVPQMKDGLSYSDESEEMRCLDIEGRDRVHTLFSGTNIVAVSPPSDEQANGIVTPDGGCLCYVLRTGFSSSQGELMQMIEFSTEQVSADSKETGMALLVLLCFALASAGYVLMKGLEKGDRTTHELLLKCVIIITSVVPRQLPVQMAMAVNQALMALTKNGIFCTEPFRVPNAGKINHCLFDKTGTLTTDQLVPVGVLNNKSMTNASDRVPCHDASPHAALVLAACHSLVELNEEGSTKQVIGDPIELAALKGVEWKYNASTQVATPGIMEDTEKALVGMKEEASRLKPDDPASKKIKRRIDELDRLLSEQKQRASFCPLSSVTIKQRHHFSSDLQRMSVVVDVKANNNRFDSGKYCLVKGSPEALFPLLAEGSVPTWYMSSYNLLAEEGMRVLALAYRRIDEDDFVSNFYPIFIIDFFLFFPYIRRNFSYLFMNMCVYLFLTDCEEYGESFMGRERTHFCWFHCFHL